MVGCLERLRPLEADFVDLYVFEKSSEMLLMLGEEKEKLVIKTLFLRHMTPSKVFPRIMICIDKMLEQPELVSIGGIRHEIGHSAFAPLIRVLSYSGSRSP